ncbi:MAG: hypothetical protein LBG67_04075 [Campylobacteraceae bacterium]|jgi:hypothetical protein|nr:hypothetical protein [Campylobacteraceae bacterium]
MVFKLGVEDVRGIQALNDRLLWVNGNYNERVADKLKEIFEDSKRGKYTTLELLDKLREEIPEYSNLEAHRLQAAADLTLRQTKNMGVASRAIGLGDKYLQVVAKMDDRTTNICRSMHLRLIPIEHIKKQYDNIVNAKSVEEIKAATNMGLSQKGLFTPDIPANIGIPPYHFGCRTFLRQVDSTYIKDREKDQFGRLYKIRDKDVYNKIKNKDDHLKASREKSVENLMRATMGNIKLEGVHNNEKDKRVILADNGFLAFIDANGNIETIFTTDRKYETPMEYFEKVTNQTYYDSLKKSNIIKVIKWILEHLK